MDLSPVSENPRPDGWPGNQQSEHEGDEATAFIDKYRCRLLEITVGTISPPFHPSHSPSLLSHSPPLLLNPATSPAAKRFLVNFDAETTCVQFFTCIGHVFRFCFIHRMSKNVHRWLAITLTHVNGF